MSDASGNREENREPHPNSLANLKRFQPGESGNPSGRPKKKLVDHALETLLEETDSQKAIEIAKVLIQKALDGDTKAAQLVAERTEGKPNQKVEVSGPDGGPINNRITVEFV